MEEYAFYRGDECVAIGTVAELSRATGLKETTIRCYATQSHINRTKKQRIVVVKIEKNDDEKEQ